MNIHSHLTTTYSYNEEDNRHPIWKFRFRKLRSKALSFRAIKHKINTSSVPPPIRDWDTGCVFCACIYLQWTQLVVSQSILGAFVEENHHHHLLRLSSPRTTRNNAAGNEQNINYPRLGIIHPLIKLNVFYVYSCHIHPLSLSLSLSLSIACSRYR